MTLAEAWTERAHRDLDDALFLFQAGRYGTAMVTAYFACLSGALALASAHGIALGKHSKVHRMADSVLRRRLQVISPEETAVLSRLRARRDEYHYQLASVDEALARDSLEQARRFLERAAAPG